MIAIFILITIVYWGAALFISINGYLEMKKGETQEMKNTGKIKMIVGIVMLIIGGGFCGSVVNL